MPQFKKHDFLNFVDPKFNLYKFVLAVAVQYEDRWYHAGSCCLLASNVAVTAKHILEFIYLQVAGKQVDFYDPDLQSSEHGFLFTPPPGVGIDVFQFLDEGKKCRRFSVTGFYRVGFKDVDLILLRIEPHELCNYKYESIETDVPIFDLIPPSVGLNVEGFGFPDHPKFQYSELPKKHYSDYYLYQGSGKVEAINWESGSAQHASFLTSMRTNSGMSGGPVFVSRGQDKVCCGIISRGGYTDYSFVTPIWRWTDSSSQKHAGSIRCNLYTRSDTFRTNKDDRRRTIFSR